MNNNKAEHAEADAREEQRILATNAWHLARFIIEHDHEIEFPENFNSGQFLVWCQKYPVLSENEKIDFINQYADLEKAAKHVTARTLVATRIHGHGFCHAACYTSVGQFLIFLFSVTILFTYLLFEGLSGSCLGIDRYTTFFAAGLGTCVYLLRVTQEKLKTRTFDPAYVPSQLIRLGLGMLAGGTIVLFPELINHNGGGGDITITHVTIAFILGYAVDIYYALLDNIGGKIKGSAR